MRPAAVRVGDRVEADIAERRLALADDDRRPVDQDAIDQILGQEGGRGGRSALDQQVVDVMKSAHILRISKDFPTVHRVAASQQRAPRRAPFQAWQAHVEPGLVGEIGAAADQDHVRMRALEVDVAARVLARDPFQFAGGQRDLAVDRQRELQRDSRPSELQAREPAGERPPGRLAAHAQLHVYPRRAKAADALA